MPNLSFLFQLRSRLWPPFCCMLLIFGTYAQIAFAQEPQFDLEDLGADLESFSGRLDDLVTELGSHSLQAQETASENSARFAELEQSIVGIEGEVTRLAMQSNPSLLERYQTLITGIIAIVTAFIGITGARRRDRELLDQKRSSLGMSLAVEMRSLSSSLQELQASLALSEIEDLEKLRFMGESLEHIRLRIYDTLIGDIGLLGEDIATAATKVSYGLEAVKRISGSFPNAISNDHAARLTSLVSSQIKEIYTGAGSVDSLIRKRFS